VLSESKQPAFVSGSCDKILQRKKKRAQHLGDVSQHEARRISHSLSLLVTSKTHHVVYEKINTSYRLTALFVASTTSRSLIFYSIVPLNAVRVCHDKHTRCVQRRRHDTNWIDLLTVISIGPYIFLEHKPTLRYADDRSR